MHLTVCTSGVSTVFFTICNSGISAVFSAICICELSTVFSTICTCEPERPTQQGHQSPSQYTATVGCLWSSEWSGPQWGFVSAPRQEWSLTLSVNCNGGTSTVFCTVWAMSTCRCIPTSMSPALFKNCACGNSMGLVTWFIFFWMMGFFLCTVSSVILGFSTSTVSTTC